jgi:hypothetical protein
MLNYLMKTFNYFICIVSISYSLNIVNYNLNISPLLKSNGGASRPNPLFQCNSKSKRRADDCGAGTWAFHPIRTIGLKMNPTRQHQDCGALRVTVLLTCRSRVKSIMFFY